MGWREGRQAIKVCFSQRLCVEKSGQNPGKLHSLSSQEVTDGLIWGGRTLISYMEMKEPQAG